MHAHTAEVLEIYADGVLASSDRWNTYIKTMSLTEVVLSRDEETIRILDNIYGYTHTNMHQKHDHPPAQLLNFTLATFYWTITVSQ